MKNPFNILVLDDNPSFLRTYHYRLNHHAHSLEVLWDCKIKVNACTNTQDFFKSLRSETQLLILDYRLGGGLKADVLLKLIRQKGCNAESIIISEGRPEFSDFQVERQHITAVLRKDSLLVPRSCLLIEEQLFKHVNQA